MTKIRLTQRRALLIKARKTAQNKVAESIRPLFQKQLQVVERFLRKGNLRKRLNKIDVSEFPLTKGESEALLKAKFLFKALTEDEKQKEQWEAWKKALLVALLLGLFEATDDLAAIENAVWTSRGQESLNYDPALLIEAYQLRTGRPLSDLGEKTMVAVYLILAQWYTSELPFAELMKMLNKYFNETRIETISINEVNQLLSQMVLQQMIEYGFSHWYWDALGEDPCHHDIFLGGRTYRGCADLNGRRFGLEDPMPPDASHVNCQCLPTPEEIDRSNLPPRTTPIGNQYPKPPLPSPIAPPSGQLRFLGKGESEGHPFRGNQWTDGESYSSLDPRSFSEEEILRAVHEYSSKGSVAVKLNHSLRNKKDLTQNLLSVKEPLEQAIRRSILDRNISVYRGEVLAEDKYEKELVERLSGDLFEDRGFLSTSYSEEKARFFSSIESRNSSVLYRIEALRGTPALDVSGKEYSSSSGEYEDEMLFLPNQKFRIKSSTTREKSSGGKLYIVDLVSVPLGEKNE